MLVASNIKLLLEFNMSAYRGSFALKDIFINAL